MQRLRAVEVLAWPLLRGAAGVKNGSSVVCCEICHLQFLESQGWDCGHQRPARRADSASVANSPIGGIVARLKLEQLHRQLLKCLAIPCPVAWNANELA